MKTNCDCHLKGGGGYLETYFSRVTHFGDSVAEVAQNTGAISFKKWLAESPNAVDLKVEDAFYFKGIILSNKQDENKISKQLCVALNVPLKIGHLVVWDDERWLVYLKERKVRETYQSFYIVRCNYVLKWVNDEGHLLSSWCHFVSSLDSKIKENFRTWNALITPQPNKYAEILLPTSDISKHTKFIVENEAWLAVEYDRTSVPGVMYVSLTEDRVNYIYDDIVKDIADTDKLAKYEIIKAQEKQVFSVGEIIEPIFSFTKNGVPTCLDYTFILPNKKVVSFNNDGKLIGVSEGEVKVGVRIKDDPDFWGEINIEVGEKNSTVLGYISGNATIKLDRICTYELIINEDFSESVVYSIDNTDLAVIIDSINTNGKVSIKANDKNKLGTIFLRAKYKELEFVKEINIIPLW